jgi:nucleoside-diphosphate-sugar epimerase
LLPNPRDIYDETKIAAEKLCLEASRNGLSSISLRMSRYFPWAREEFFKRGWSLPKTIDRVYVIEQAARAQSRPFRGELTSFL